VIDLHKKQQIILRHIEGMSNREIARQLGMSKDTVNKYVREYDQQRQQLLANSPGTDKDSILQSFVEEPTYDASGRSPTKVTGEVEQLILECLEENRRKRESGRQKQQMKIVDIHAYIRKKGYDVSYSSVKRTVRRLRNTSPEAFIRQEYQPGQTCEFDWGTVKLNIGGTGYRKYQMAVFTAADSNNRFARLYKSQDTAAFLESHADFFSYCGGAFHEMVYDNMKVAVKRFVGTTEKEPTEAMLQISAYYGFRYRFCNVASGNEKGHVERSVEYVRRRVFSQPGCDVFATLADANRFLQAECEKLNQLKGADGVIPAEEFQTEKKHLLPAVPKFECCIRQKAHVDKYATVVFLQNHYSVPDTLVDKDLEIRVYTDRLLICKDGKPVAQHPRSFRNHVWVIDIYHYLRTLRRKPGALARSTAMLQADTQIKYIYETYYSENPKAFLDTLPIIREKGTSRVLQALRELDRMTTSDKSADKVRVICDNHDAEGRNAVGSDRISRLTQQTLPDYDLLMKAMNRPERTAV